MALLSRRVEVPEQRQNLAQKASYVALFRNMCASGPSKAGAIKAVVSTEVPMDSVFV